jgi:hypothetical protein
MTALFKCYFFIKKREYKQFRQFCQAFCYKRKQGGSCGDSRRVNQKKLKITNCYSASPKNGAAAAAPLV